MKRLYHILHRLSAAVVIVAAMLAALPSLALRPERYASSSVLSEGRWAKVPVTKAGVQFVGASTLRAMGFTDISKVNVYGYGGRLLPESLNASMPDDLPLIPSVKTSKGIIFFGTDNISWAGSSSDVPFTHTVHPYATESWYFLSDRDADSDADAKVPAPAASLPMSETFMERLVHEQDLQCPDETGRIFLGEDFVSQKTRSFSFTLPGATGDDAFVRICVGADVKSKTTTPMSSITVKANGQQLPATTSDRINGTSESSYIALGTTVKTVENPGDRLTLDITYSAQATPRMARLDFIEVFYPRRMSLSSGSLYFYTNEASDMAAVIDGCSESTVIWDVTDPSRPREMEFSLSGTKASVFAGAGYHEYLAVDPDKISTGTSVWQRVDNQDIHSMDTPDMVIISLPEYLDASERIAAVHRQHDGLDVAVLSAQSVYNEFSGGTPDISAFRRLLKMWFDRSGEHSIRYCLLMGRPHFDQRLLTQDGKGMGYNPMPIWMSTTGTSETSSYSTDAYVGMLADCEESSFSMRSAKIHVAVGRLPVKSTLEADRMAEKIEKYVTQPTYGSWRNKIMIISDDADYDEDEGRPLSQFIDQSENVYNIMRSSRKGKTYFYSRVYLDAHKVEYSSIGKNYPTAKAQMMRNFNDGVIFSNYIGHASPTSWSHEKLLLWSDMNSWTNPNLTFLLAATCSFGKWDANAVSGGELMVMNPTAGAIGMIVPSRTVYITNNARLNNAFASYIFAETEIGEKPRVGDFYRRGMNELSEDNKLRYCLISDPAIALPNPDFDVEIEEIDGKAPATGDDAPVIPALGKVPVKGVVRNADGDVAEDFSGTIDLQLYDAEKVISTTDAGASISRFYNDRSVRLTTTTVKVENGRWEANLLLPSEIQNNYSPALISAYAWNSATGGEAHGYTEDLYVYGAAENSEDTTSPSIEAFYLNTPSFTDGGVVSGNPLVFASFFDESGINLSDSGIGHKMTLTLDGKKVYSDVNSYFAVDPSREGAGSICYPLEDIEPGKHTLAVQVWDNANNSSTAHLEFNVGAALDPVITDLSTNVNPATTSVVFSVGIDRPNTRINCLLEVFDLSGRRVWSKEDEILTDMQSTMRVDWDLKDKGGVRVPRGIYLYRATVTSPEGTYTSKTRKLAVTAQ